MSDRLKIFSNGQEVVEFFEQHLLKEMSAQKIDRTYQPVALLLIDINMPILNGMETVPKIKKLFTEFNNLMREGP